MTPTPTIGRRWLLAALLAITVLLLPYTAFAAAETVTVTVNLLQPSTEAPSSPLPESLGATARWAQLDRGVPFAPTASSASVKAWASRFPGGCGIVVANTAAEPVTVRIDTRLSAGLWRVDATLTETDKTRVWRMESALRPKAGAVVKPVALPGGAALFLRWQETVAAARADLARLRTDAGAQATGSDRQRMERSFGMVSASLAGLPPLIGRGDRPGIVRKVHRALLAAAEAEAIWKNGRSSGLTREDTLFDGVKVSLSEISCAAHNLVPVQTETLGADGERSVRVSITNAGPRSVPLVSLGIASPSGGAAGKRADMVVVGALSPGAKAAATFRSRDPEARGMVQFILSHGAAVVPAAPTP